MQQHFPFRQAIVCEGRDGVVRELLEVSHSPFAGAGPASERRVAFLFPGVGTQYAGMAAQLYATEPFFTSQIDSCCDLVRKKSGLDLRDILFSPAARLGTRGRGKSEKINFAALVGGGRDREPDAWDRLEVVQPAMFIVEYALAKLWLHWGVQPDAMLGYSLGELVAACVAGVFSQEGALEIVMERARLASFLPRGAMLAVPMAWSEISPWIEEPLQISAVHGPGMCILGGPPEPLHALQKKLNDQGIASQAVRTSHAFHTRQMRDIAGPFKECIERVPRAAPSRAFLSNLTGTWITAEEAVSSDYWVEQMCQPVRFADGLVQLGKSGYRIFLEIGPGQSLSGLAVAQFLADGIEGLCVASTLPAPYETADDEEVLIQAAGSLWEQGIELNWEQIRNGGRRAVVSVAGNRFLENEVDHDIRSQERSSSKPPAPYTATEGKLIEIWEEKFKGRNIRADDSFFDLGGDSVVALQILLRVKDQFGVAMDVVEFLQNPVLSKMAGRIEQKIDAHKKQG
jgi:acyl transferase domain-containing protein